MSGQVVGRVDLVQLLRVGQQFAFPTCRVVVLRLIARDSCRSSLLALLNTRFGDPALPEPQMLAKNKVAPSDAQICQAAGLTRACART